MNEDLVEKLIEDWIPICKSFSESGQKAKRKAIAGTIRKRIEAEVGNPCPTCSEILIPPEKLGHRPKRGYSPPNRSVTVEHIVPRTLGGDNRESNLISMCYLCNMCRNITMTKLMPEHTTLRIRKLSDAEFEKLKQFVAWSIRTVHTPKSEFIDPEIQGMFEASYTKHSESDAEKRAISPKPTAAAPSPDTGEQATLSQLLTVLEDIRGDQRDLLRLMKQRRVPLLVRIFRRVTAPFRRGPPNRIESVVQQPAEMKELAQPPMPEAEEEREPVQIESEVGLAAQLSELENDAERRASFQRIIESLLTEKISLMHLGTKVRDYQEEQGWPEKGTPAFLQEFGIPKRHGLRKAIENLMSDRVIISGEAPKHMIELRVKPEQTEEEKKPKVAAVTKSGAIRGFNTAAKTGQSSLKFPADPVDLHTILCLVESRRGEGVTWKEVRTHVQAANGLSKNRVDATTSMIGFCTESMMNPSHSIDWSVFPGTPALLELLNHECVHRLTSYSGYTYVEDEAIPLVREYFGRVASLFND